MNGPTNEELTNALSKRADDFARLGGHDLDLAQVMSRAGEIQRGRRMRATIAMAAVVLAIAVPVGVVALQNRPGTSPEPPLATNSTSSTTPSPSPTQSPTVVPTSDPISLEGLQSGDRSMLPYAVNGKIHDGGVTIQPPGTGEIGALARITGGYLVGRYSGSGETAMFLFDDGSRPLTWPMADGSGFVVNDDDSVGAFIQPDGQVVAVQDGGSRFFDVGTPVVSADGLSLDAIQADSCTDRSETNICTVWVTTQGQKPEVSAVSQHHGPNPVFPGWLKLNDIGFGGERPLFAGQISSSNEGSCSQVSELSGDVVRPLWKTCDNSLRTFSPDGQYLLAGPAYGDGPGDGIVTVLEARTGKKVTTIRASDQVVMAAYVWEDDSHILAVVEDLAGQGRAGLVRIGLDGSRELVAPIVEVSPGGDYRIGDR